MTTAITAITAAGFKDKKKNDRHNMNNKKFDRLVAESTRRSLMESQRIDEWGKIVNAGKNLWKGFKAAKKGTLLGKAGLNGSRAGEYGYKMAQNMGFGRKALQADLNAFRATGKGRLADAYNNANRLIGLQRNANRWRMAGGMGLAGLAGYGLAGGGGEAPGADMAGAGMDGMYPGGDMGGMYPGGPNPGGAYPGGTNPGGAYPGGPYPGGGYGDSFYGPDPNSLYAYMGGNPYGYGDTFGYGFGSQGGSGYGGAYNDSGMDPMMMYYMMNGGF